MRSFKRFFCLFLWLVLILPQAQPAEPVQKTVMVVFVHGTVGPHFSLKAIGGWFTSLFKKKTQNVGIFQKYIEQVKRHGIHRRQPINELGFCPIDISESINKKDFTYLGKQTSCLYKSVYDTTYPDNKENLKFYTFSWSGALSQKARRKAGAELYPVLCNEAKLLREQTNLPVEIWLLGHSHGANVILYLEKEEQKRKKKLIVDKAIFVGGPVQTETEQFVNGHVFKNIYNIYSKGDHMQRLDVVSTKDWFSRQTFGSHKKKKIDLPANLSQIEVTVGEHKPYHYELWLWGRKKFPHFLYRKSLSIHPLPLSVFTPVIISMVDSLEKPEDSIDVYHLHIDGKSGRFDLCGTERHACRTLDVAGLCDQGLAAL